MKTVNTVLGPLPAQKMGFTLMHEHVLITSAGLKDTYPEVHPRERAIREGIRRLTEAKREGVDTVVDLTTFDLGRDIRVIEYVSRASGVNIIAATGTWLEVPRAFKVADPDDIAALYVREITVGIEGTGIKAGVIKVANDVGGVTEAGEIILKAAARAQKKTGVPIITHTWAPEKTGEQQMRVFDAEGLDPNRVCIGHSNDTTDLGYLTGLLKRGVWIGFDRYPSHRPDVPDWKVRTQTLKALMDAGYSDRLMVSHDDPMTMTIAPRAAFDQRIVTNPDHVLFITRKVLPYLRSLGASDADIRKVVVENPRRFFEGS